MFKMEEIVSYAKKNGFVYPGSEIYNGLANSWDYGPRGVELKNNLKKLWWQKFITSDMNSVGIDSSIILNSSVWKASGHIGGFNDPLIDCKQCKGRFRADKLIEENYDLSVLSKSVEAHTLEEMEAIIESIKCPVCKAQEWTKIRQFELMFNTNMGVIKDEGSKVYLRPETAQGIFINFKNIQTSMRKKLPLGIGQVGKSFRNEITPGNFIFRTREFEQMELEFFTNPAEADKWYKHYQQYCYQFLIDLGFAQDNLVLREHDSEELSHYSAGTTDIEYKFPFGQSELWGIANRTDFDLRVHQLASKVDLSYLDPISNTRYLPYCIEPSVGVDRLFLAVLCEALTKEKISENDERIVLKIDPKIAPQKVLITPLVKKYHGEKAVQVYQIFAQEMVAEYDDTGSIGKRYRRADEVGIPFTITIDDQSIENNVLTIRDRDTMEQITLSIEEAIEYVKQKIKI